MISFRKKTILWVSSILVPLLLLILFFNFQTLSTANKHIQDSAFNVIALYRQIRERDLQKIERLLLNFVTSNASYQQLRYPTDEYVAFSNIYDVTQRYSELISSFPEITCIYFSSQENNVSRTVFGEGYSGQYEFKEALQLQLRELIQAEPNPTSLGWHYITVNEAPLLVRAIGSGGLFSVCVVNPQRWILPTQNGTAVFYADSEGRSLLAGMSSLPLEKLDSPEQGQFISWENPFSLVFYEKSSYTDTYICYSQSDGLFLEAVSPLSLIALFATIGLIAIIPFLIAELNRTSFQPMDELIRTMQKIRQNGFSAKMSENYPVREFYTLSITFNHMIDEIQNLKIESYEKELMQQRTRYALLQTQIRPHFYLNCLKNIQALAFAHDWQKIESLVLCLSDFLRHLFAAGQTNVPLQKEICSIQSFINIQNISRYHPIQFECVYPEAFSNFLIPPLSILTFVENSVKYANQHDLPLEIHVKCILLESGEEQFLNISISDNGAGFPPDLLEELNSRTYVPEPGHLGISNVFERFTLEYGTNTSIVFSNLSPGAGIDIYIPLDKDDCHDCANR